MAERFAGRTAIVTGAGIGGLGRQAWPEDIVGTVLFLCSSDSDFMTGLKGVGPEQGRRVVLAEDHQRRHALAVDCHPRLPDVAIRTGHSNVPITDTFATL